ncbi:MAG: dihydroorotate dehydrogenase electron transfer subunit [Bacillota bacterium]
MVPILSNESLAPNLFLLTVKDINSAAIAKPGQFCNFKVSLPGSYDPLLRRPLSIFSADKKSGHLKFLYKVVGRGTKALSKYKKGEKIDYLGPLGRGFNLDYRDKNLLLVGGGVGLAPLYFLASELDSSNRLSLCFGAENKEFLEPLSQLFSSFSAELNLSTDDGSLGKQGPVSCLLSPELKQYSNYSFLYACGPRAMLKWLQKWMSINRLSGQFSIEERMACGIGLCLSCSCQTVQGNQRVCKEGPVFPAQEVIF